MASTTPDSPVSDDGVDICYETFGFPHDPAILLLAGGGSSMLFWPEDFCHYLRKNRRYLIRYDYRDTGKSVTVAPGAATYTLSDFADDALQILINV
jgi:pimeloyl-ACP methyl ester carboxylesterase